ncbi:MAG: flavin reductase family protein [Alphaproteobacteria bacterium]|jgi:flavin reductase (DIM6/NTAB) family NADH-FMN oxidoreductase RutF|uniref:flavin reductase family protein n=1 Tax=Pseudorhizobium pelagicum TaxID=1509405 RepID=UPI001D24A143|nr:flavin reductase family protein [Alphaproteobacteria bacterium]MBU1550787.1 flavin reductase family protein [Alphaproteobacteria bacterium]MBU2338923.1 flavin reductase family protein [Alphaproteobacteria bacterium]MBU2387014.1 flavin reductase family protein [Alphaproteobacteria bacterium]|tara:strand:+ start:145 stop:753 length:609 start_codon:yes stop_codon:yes gene_type:complete
MFYDTETNAHGMSHDPFKAIVAPRPIGWIGTRGRDGSINLSPYSFFNIVSDTPKIIMFSSTGRKDSLRNAEETGVFTASLASRHLAEAVNASSVTVPYGTDEFALAGVTPAPGTLVDAPYVAEAYTALECRVTEILQPHTLKGGKAPSYMVFGEVVGIHIREEVIRDGRIDMALLRPIARMGYRDFSDGGAEVFELTRPAGP